MPRNPRVIPLISSLIAEEYKIIKEWFKVVSCYFVRSNGIQKFELPKMSSPFLKERWNSDFIIDKRISTKGVSKKKGEEEFHYRI